MIDIRDEALMGESMNDIGRRGLGPLERSGSYGLSVNCVIIAKKQNGSIIKKKDDVLPCPLPDGM